MRVVLRSKIHRAYVTATNQDYIGSIVIDGAIMDKADLCEYEKVLICNVTNGYRWETYVIAGEEGSGTISVQGAGARLCDKGDVLVILAFEVTDKPIAPRMILVNEQNQFVEYLEGAHHAAPVHGA